MKTLDEITQQIDALNTRATGLLSKAEAGESTVAEVKALIDGEIKPALDVLTADRDAALRAEEMKALTGQVTNLSAVIEDLRKPSGGFAIGSVGGKSLGADDNPYFAADGTPKRSYFADVRLAAKGNSEAIKRITHGVEEFEGKALNAEGKAMTEGTNGQGGYLVLPQIERQLVLARELDNVLRGLCSILPVNVTGIQLDQLGLSSTAGWVAELAVKPEGTAMTLSSITASVFTAAGLATISNQLLADSNPAIDGLVTADLTKRLVALEETAFLSGTGTGQPLGLLNTPGLHTTVAGTAGDPAVAGGLLDNILDAIADVQTYWGQPTAILMHPRTWTRIIKSRNSVGTYTINPQPNAGGGYDVRTPRTYVSTPQSFLTVFGVPVILTNRMPTNLGAGTNESRVIVGDFREALILDRQGITVDESPHVYFTSNQTVFRAETRVGFTAARAPAAFNVIGGTGLANG